ncbi:branched-chain amino acid aminotransferase [Zhongshania aquimaris]|uniref:Branched-chain-amino-acid aminotransferase n=1 Tax=Zhongshania aquimaris TaxID=2857107 RepID=A0ABS6VXA1_9GAMM|nr:branched-chain amino acid aminotransferase [Zhongshania aquimaris]MBW2942644.1 branched-chain amino acid aminotransferase [Zhongshania aquimaris]
MNSDAQYAASPAPVIASGVLPVLKQFTLPEALGFGRVMAPIMYRAQFRNGGWQAAQVLPYEAISIDPAAKVLHYAQEVFEGLKAYRHSDNNVSLFRPLENWKRFNRSADRMCMPAVPESIFMDGVSAVSSLMAKHIPAKPGQSLYLRPFMIGVDASLGLAASLDNDFYVIASPSEVYQQGSFKVMIERQDCRAALGGTGNVKVGGNYAAALAAGRRVQAAGFDQSLWLDPAEHRYIEELSGMNVFALINGALHTPSLSGSILPGITRDSVLQLARLSGVEVIERSIDINELLEAVVSGECSEVFACGTAAVITPISIIADGDIRYEFKAGNPFATQLHTLLTDIQEGRGEDVFNWNWPLTDVNVLDTSDSV